MQKEKLVHTAQRTEEVRDIIDRMPHRTGRIVAIAVTVFASLLIVSGFYIKYPESVSGAVTIRAQKAPVRLTAPATGRLHLLVRNNQALESGDIVAYIESGANIADFLYLDSMITLAPEVLAEKPFSTSTHLALGELTVQYLKLKSSIDLYQLYKHENPYVPKLRQLRIQKEGNEKMEESTQIQLALQRETNAIQAQNLHNDSIQYFQLKSLNEPAYLQSKVAYLNSLQNLNLLQKEKKQTGNQIREIETQISQLLVEQNEQEQKLTTNIYTAYHELKNQVSQWKQKYTFVAPYSGKLEMLNFWEENSFVQAGEEIFAVLPALNPVTAQVLIPSMGAGKVALGQEVIIKLDDFPYMEFGTVSGKVKSISMLTTPQEGFVAQQKINTYQVIVGLPEQLKTNYGSLLSFKHDIKGTAQILVKKRKLIERLFDNLKYLANE